MIKIRWLHVYILVWLMRVVFARHVIIGRVLYTL